MRQVGLGFQLRQARQSPAHAHTRSHSHMDDEQEMAATVINAVQTGEQASRDEMIILAMQTRLR